MKMLCPCCLGKGIDPAKVNEPCPCCEGSCYVSEPAQQQWVAKYGFGSTVTAPRE